jgi:hypothetical protein
LITLQEAKDITGGLTSTSKMPCKSFSIPAQACKMGSKLVGIKGSVCEGCYALKGFYQFPAGIAKREDRLKNIYNPKWVNAMALLINKQSKDFFRWHDSGDLQGMLHIMNILRVCRATPQTKHWLPTREYKLITDLVEGGYEVPENINIRLSALMVDGVPPTALANRLNEFPNVKGIISTSGVAKDKLEANCPAYKQNNTCGSCRTCWTSKGNVNYKFH